jgi:chaperonin GroEL
MENAKQLLFNLDVRQKISEGVKIISDAVGSTLGPKGNNVILELKYSSPLITNDGVTIAQEINVEDAYQNLAIELVKQAAGKTNDEAGDGTTTAVILTDAIYQAGIKLINNGMNPIQLKRKIDRVCNSIIEELKKQAIPVKEKKDLINVATISANNDSELGNLVADVMEKIGDDGIIAVEDSLFSQSKFEIVEGLKLESGYLSPYFANREDGTCVFEDCLCVIIDKRIAQFKFLMKTLQIAKTANKSLLIIADGIEGEALNNLIMNNIKGIVSVCAIRIPGFADKKTDILDDISTITGSTIINETSSVKLDALEMKYFGKIKKVIISKDGCTVISNEDFKENIDKKINSLKLQIESTKDDFNKDILKERLAKLAGGIGVIYAGASTELEMKEKKMRIEDAIHATKAAMEEGILPGGGLSLFKIAKTASLYESSKPLSDDDIVENMMITAIESILFKIMDNAGLSNDEKDFIIKSIIDSSYNLGFDANTNTTVNMIENGIIDPLKVVRLALQNAASIAGMLLTTGCIISKLPPKEQKLILQQQNQI